MSISQTEERRKKAVSRQLDELADAHIIGCADSSNGEHEEVHESLEHLIADCPLYESQRKLTVR